MTFGVGVCGAAVPGLGVVAAGGVGVTPVWDLGVLVFAAAAVAVRWLALGVGVGVTRALTCCCASWRISEVITLAGMASRARHD